MSSVVIAGNTSGTITLDAPNVAGTTVLTLPTTSGTIGLYAAPQVTVYTSGSGTYTVPTGAKYLVVEMSGGGGGGSGSGVGGGFGSPGATGGTSTFGSSLLTCTGGNPGTPAGGASVSGTGGLGTIGAGASGFALQGGTGLGVTLDPTSSGTKMGAPGGVNPFGGGGGFGVNTTSSVTNAPANTGAGGIGGTAPVNYYIGTGGGAGGYIKAFITSPSATYSYAIGAGGAGGAKGSSGYWGEAGVAGIIIITAYFG